MKAKIATTPKLEPFLFKWKREARLYRERAADWHQVGDWQNKSVCEGKAAIAEEMVKELADILSGEKR
jgi:hypothetical protein